MTEAAPAGGRVQPFYCPYCGEGDFVPGQSAGEYHCRSCDRRWSVRFLGLGPAGGG